MWSVVENSNVDIFVCDLLLDIGMLEYVIVDIEVFNI